MECYVLTREAERRRQRQRGALGQARLGAPWLSSVRAQEAVVRLYRRTAPARASAERRVVRTCGVQYAHTRIAVPRCPDGRTAPRDSTRNSLTVTAGPARPQQAHVSMDESRLFNYRISRLRRSRVPSPSDTPDEPARTPLRLRELRDPLPAGSRRTIGRVVRRRRPLALPLRASWRTHSHVEYVTFRRGRYIHRVWPSGRLEIRS